MVIKVLELFIGFDFNIEKGEVVENFRNFYSSVATLNDNFEGINIVNRVEEKERKQIKEISNIKTQKPK